ARELGRGPAHVAEEGLAQGRLGQARRRDPGEAVHLPAAERPGVLEREVHALPELARARRVAGDAAVATLGIAGRQVDLHDLDARGPGARGEVARAPAVRELDLDRAEAGARGGFEALRERPLREQHADVG